MRSERQNILLLFTVPDELRKIADAMDALWSDAGPGDNLAICDLGPACERIRIVIDQDLMARPVAARRDAETEGP